jgi:hypothetical protein
MADNSIQVKIGANLTDADAALDAFAGRAGDSLNQVGPSIEGVTAKTEGLNEGRLSSRESARLLTEELGIHMPRAVTSAMSEMLPAIGGMGTAMLGVFAVEEVYKFGKAAVEMMHELQSETKELAADWTKVISEQEKLLRNPKTISDAIKDIAETNAQLADSARHVTDLKTQLDKLPMGAALAALAISGAIDEWEDKEKKLNERLADQENAYGQLGVAAKKAAEGATAALAGVEKHGAAEARFIQEVLAEYWRWEKESERIFSANQKDWDKALENPPKLRMSIDAALSALTMLGNGFHQLTAAERSALPFTINLNDALNTQAQRLKEEVAEIANGALPALKKLELQYDRQIDVANKSIAKARQEYQQHKITTEQMAADEKAYTDIVTQSATLRTAAYQKEAVVMGSSLASSLGLEKEYVVAEAIFNIPKEIGEAAADFAIGDEWGGALHLMSAAQWGIAAGKGVASIAGGSGKKSSSSSSASTSSSSAAASSSSTDSSSSAPGGQYMAVQQLAVQQLVVSDLVISNLTSGIDQAVNQRSVLLRSTVARRIEPL